MKGNTKAILIILLCIVLIGGTAVLVNDMNKKKLINEVKLRTESEMKSKQLEKELIIIRQEKEEIRKNNDKLAAIIEYQKTNPQIIINKYESKANDISRLNPTESFKLFTNNLFSFSNNPERFDLQRFK